MKQLPDAKNITLDELVALTEKAARTIERLYAEASKYHQRIEELERSEKALKKDAEWCRWFRRKYGDSIFFSHIEQTYVTEHSASSRSPGSFYDDNSASTM